MGFMKRRFQILTAALALVLLSVGLTPAALRAQTAAISTLCTAGVACFVFTPGYAAGPAAVDLYLDGKLVAGNVGLSDSSAVIPVAPGTHWLQLPATASAPSAAAITAYVTFDAGAVYDLVLRSDNKAPRLSLYKVDPAAPVSGLSRSRIVNLWIGSGSIDVDLGEPGDKTGGAPDARFLSVRENGASGYVETGLFTGQSAVSVFAAGTATLNAAPGLRPCPVNSICSYVLIGPAGKTGAVQYSVAVFPV